MVLVFLNSRGSTVNYQKNTVKIRPGMILSNEPGYYKNNFGIRIENLVYVNKKKIYF